MTIIMQCENCKPHTYQDGKYGFLNRVFNLMFKDRKFSKKGRCTVCGYVQAVNLNIGTPEPEEKKKEEK